MGPLVFIKNDDESISAAHVSGIFQKCKKVEVIASGKACFQLSTGFLGDFGHIITSVSFLTFILLMKIKISLCIMKVVDGIKKVSKIWF